MIDKLSLPKDKIRVLLLEGINDSAASLFTAAGYTNVTRLPKALDPAALHD
ncbi:phosphoglycerate dehydrogenase, partial [Methylobacterium oryzihabitans]